MSAALLGEEMDQDSTVARTYEEVVEEVGHSEPVDDMDSLNAHSDHNVSDKK